MDGIIDLGLKRGSVELLEHSDLWEGYAKDIIDELWSIFGNTAIDIQHTGSTAIKGIKAKPIIDIAVGVNSLNEVYKLIDELADNNFIHRPISDDDVFFVRNNKMENLRTHHIHVVIYKGDRWNNQICFRNYLNNNPDEAKRYERLKVDLQKENAFNRNGYTENKHDYIFSIIEKEKGDNVY